MRKTIGILLLLCGGIFCAPHPTFGQQIQEENCFYLSSLHYTARGMSYWYEKANGGLETLTGVPYGEAGCGKCHVSSCDACHKTEIGGKPAYSTKAAKGMTCMDCHTSREVHGDGAEWKSMKEPGAMDAKCESCHDSPPKSVSHTVHGDKLDCKSCHVRHVVSCNSCHFETMVKEKKRVSRPVHGWKFLMNYNGKVTAANMQTFVAPGNKTFLMFAPQFSHSVKKDGTRCEECHGTVIVGEILKERITISWLEDGKERNLKGVIPVVDGVRYHLVYQNYDKGTWTVIANPPAPKVQYVGYGTPLSKEQVRKLANPQKLMEKVAATR